MGEVAGSVPAGVKLAQQRVAGGPELAGGLVECGEFGGDPAEFVEAGVAGRGVTHRWAP